MLLPGFSAAFHATTLGRSPSMVSVYRKRAQGAAERDPGLKKLVRELMVAFTPADGARMAQLRGSAQLPYWSRLAICDWHKRGASRQEIADLFRCSKGTVTNVLTGRTGGYQPTTGARQLSASQTNPPGKFYSKHQRWRTLLGAYCLG